MEGHHERRVSPVGPEGSSCEAAPKTTFPSPSLVVLSIYTAPLVFKALSLILLPSLK